VLGSRTSPLLQEKLVLLGGEHVFKSVPPLVESLLGIQVSESQVYRVTQAVGEAMDPQALQSPSAALEATENSGRERVYGMVDGSMLFTDEGWQECKVGRVFKADLKAAGLKAAGLADTLQWDMGPSEYVAHKGRWREFTQAFESLLPPQSDCEQVFVTDGALWISRWIGESYPKAVQILDIFHVLEKLAAVKTGKWLDRQKQHLIQGRQKAVRRAVARSGYGHKQELLAYLENNAQRMEYDKYRAAGMMIGSGPVESAHRTLLQVRMKRSGQRWSEKGCGRMLKLRVASKSEKWNLVTNLLKKQAA
jgi:hypothetical protein